MLSPPCHHPPCHLIPPRVCLNPQHSSSSTCPSPPLPPPMLPPPCLGKIMPPQAREGSSNEKVGVLHHVSWLAAPALSRLGESLQLGDYRWVLSMIDCCSSAEGLVVFLPHPGGSRQISSDSRLTYILTLIWYRPVNICPSTMVVPEAQDKMYHPPDDLKRDAHVPDFNSYLAMYRKSLENPEGRSNASIFLVTCSKHFLAFHLPPSMPLHSIPLCLSAPVSGSLQRWQRALLCFSFLERGCRWVLLEEASDGTNAAVQLWRDKRKHLRQVHGRGQNQHVL